MNRTVRLGFGVGVALGFWALALGPAAAEPGGAEGASSEDVAVSRAKWTQEEAPRWAARAEAAAAKRAARVAYFDGKATLAEGFPQLVGASLESLSVLGGRLDALDEAEAKRARERVAPLPEVTNRPAALALRQGALDDESEADALERRLLLALRGLIEARPAVSAERLAGGREGLRAAMRAEAPADATPEQKAEISAAAARADEDLRLLNEVLHALWRAASVPEVEVPAPVDELIRLGDALTRDQAAMRLWLLRPVVLGAGRVQLDAALLAYEQGPQHEAVVGQRAAAAQAIADVDAGAVLSAEEASAAVTKATAALSAATLRLGAAPEGAEPLALARRENLELLRQAAEDRLGAAKAAQARVGRLAAAGVDTEAAGQGRAEADAARLQAEAAEAAADDTRGVLFASLLKGNAAAQQRRSDVATRVAEAKALQSEPEAALDASLADLEDRLAQVKERAFVDPARPDPDAIYHEVRKLLVGLRQGPAVTGETKVELTVRQAPLLAELATDRASLSAFEEQMPLLSQINEPGVPTAAQVIARWREALAATALELSAESAHIDAARDSALKSTRRARAIRRAVRPYASSAGRDADRRFWLEDLGQELWLLPATLFGMLKARWEMLSGDSGSWLDYNVLRSLFTSSFWTMVFIGGWLWARGRDRAWAHSVVKRVDLLGLRLRPKDAAALQEPTARFLRAFVDLLLGWSLVNPISMIMPEAGFLVTVYLQVALFRAGLALFDLAVVRQPELRPALVSLNAEQHDLARLSARLLLGWWILASFVQVVLWDVFWMDAVAELARLLLNLGGLVLLGWLAWRWEPVLRDRVARRNKASRVVRLLAEPVGGPLLRPARGLAQLAFFAVSGLVDAWYWLVQNDRTGLGKVFTAVTRYRLTTTEQVKREPLPEAISRELCVDLAGDQLAEATVGRLCEVHSAWREEGRRGLVAVVGDRGEGKAQLITRFLEVLEDTEAKPERVEVEGNLTESSRALAWLAGVLGVEAGEDVEAFVEAAREAPARVVVIEEAHRFFVRRVGGFAALETLLYVVNATSSRHCWVLVFHRPAWRFLSALTALVDTSIFRAVIDIEPLGPVQLRELTAAHAKEAGYTLDFSALSQVNAFGSDPEVELERSIGSYYRLLAEASEGNAWVALRLFARCLSLGEGRALVVHTSVDLKAETVPDLSDAALFVLMACRVHERLQEAAMVDVTNLNAQVVRSVVRDLIARGLLAESQGYLRVPTPELPRVSRTLRRRHLMHL